MRAFPSSSSGQIRAGSPLGRRFSPGHHPLPLPFHSGSFSGGLRPGHRLCDWPVGSAAPSSRVSSVFWGNGACLPPEELGVPSPGQCPRIVELGTEGRVGSGFPSELGRLALGLGHLAGPSRSFASAALSCRGRAPRVRLCGLSFPERVQPVRPAQGPGLPGRFLGGWLHWRAVLGWVGPAGTGARVLRKVLRVIADGSSVLPPRSLSGTPLRLAAGVSSPSLRSPLLLSRGPCPAVPPRSPGWRISRPLAHVLRGGLLPGTRWPLCCLL